MVEPTQEDRDAADRILALPYAYTTNQTAPPIKLNRGLAAAKIVAAHRIAAVEADRRTHRSQDNAG